MNKYSRKFNIIYPIGIRCIPEILLTIMKLKNVFYIIS